MHSERLFVHFGKRDCASALMRRKPRVLKKPARRLRGKQSVNLFTDWYKPAWLAALLSVAALALIGCGFQPLYGDYRAGGKPAQLAQIQISHIDNRIGQIMRNRLLDRLTPNGEPSNPRFVLEVTVSEQTEELAIRETFQATRENLTLSTSYRLLDKKTQRLLSDGDIRVITGYDLVAKRFADLIAKRDAQKRAAESTADDLISRLAVFFYQHQASAP